MARVVEKDRRYVLHPITDAATHARSGPSICVVSGDGIYVEDIDGRRYVEASGGAWCLALGHGEEQLVRAAADQMRKLSYSPGFFGRACEPVALLAERLTAMAPFAARRVLFTNSGSEANDTQLRLLWYANNLRGEPQRKKVLTRHRAYHGSSGLSAGLTGLPVFHADFNIPDSFVRRLTAPHLASEGVPGEDEAAFVSRLRDELKDTIEAEGPETIAAFFAEPVMAAGGVLIPPKGYFPAMQEVLDPYDIPLVADEVVTAFGRTGAVWGSDTMSVRPSSLTLAKQLSSAYLPIGAVVVGEDLEAAAIEGSDRHGVLGHGFTYGGHPVCAAVALRTLELFDERDVYGHAEAMSAVFEQRILQLAGHPLVAAAEGIGLIGAIELDPEVGVDPWDPALLSKHCVDECMREGLLVRQAGLRTCFCPPLIIDAEQIDEMFGRYERVLDRLLTAGR